MTDSTIDQYINAAIQAGVSSLKSGVPEEQLFYVLKTVYKTVLNEGQIRLAANAALFKFSQEQNIIKG